MNQIEFKDRFIKERDIYEYWGEFVTEQIIQTLASQVDVSSFLKIQPIPRVKDTGSLIAKAFLRGKTYSDPYAEITDKVGTRFIVLLVEEIDIIKSIVQNCDHWTFSLDRDFEKERREKPLLFDYQSVHYVVKSKRPITWKGLEIPGDIPCEIQIRTLLQHAYAELAHNIIYKPSKQVPPEVYRVFGASMALIETTDNLFIQAHKTYRESVSVREGLMNDLYQVYIELVDRPEVVEKLNDFIFDAIEDIVDQSELSSINQYIRDNSYLVDIIKSHYSDNLLYRQPIVLLLYYLINKKPYMFFERWPLPRNYLESLFTDLGCAMPYS